MKIVTGNTQTALDTAHGTEPVLIVEIIWDTGASRFYADKDVFDILGKLLEVSSVEVMATSNRSNQTVTIKIDDTDGEIKQVIDNVNVHKVKCRIYQAYTTLLFTDKFLLFEGLINTPFVWDETDRSLELTVNSELESYEVGFSPEEGQLDFVSPDFIGKPWPLCFGDVVHVPAQKVHQVLTGTLLERIGIVDQTLTWKLERLQYTYSLYSFMFTWWKLALQLVDTICEPKATELLDAYVEAIKKEDAILLQITQVLTEIERVKSQIQKNPFDRAWKVDLTNWEVLLNQLANQSHELQVIKYNLERLTALLLFEHETSKKIAQAIIDAYNGMDTTYAEIVDVLNEICLQQKLVKDCFLIEGGSEFPQEIETEVVIGDVKYRGTFDGDLFCKTDGPYAKYQNIEVDTWVFDDDECAPEDEKNGLAVFYLKTPIDLTGLFLLVKRRGSDDTNAAHIIQVVQQIGTKVIFELIKWDKGSSAPRGHSIPEMVGKLVQPSTDPDPALYNTPETTRLQQIISQIPGGVNQREYEVLATLCFLEPWDQLDQKTLLIQAPTPRSVFTIIGEDVASIIEGSGTVHEHWLTNFDIPYEEIPETLEWTADAGSTVRLTTDDCEIYVANILPSTIKAVYAYRKNAEGKRFLAPIPISYYTKQEAAPLGTITVTALVFPFGLSNIPGEGWEEEVYVTLESTVGPNVCDVIQHLIETYTVGGSVDPVSFADVKAKFRDDDDAELYPANFALIDRPNVIQEITRIAWEARCGLTQVGTVFYIKYLAEEPTPDLSFDLSDIETETLKVQFTATEELVTRLIAVYKPNYLPIENRKKRKELVYRHNVKIYGLQSREELFHIYNIPSLVEKSATFWLIRLSNTWKTVTFKSFMASLRLDAFDTLELALGRDFFADDTVKGVVQQSIYDPGDNSIQLSVQMPIKSGTMEEYFWYWPAQKQQDAEFPTSAEIELGYGGGYGPGTGVQGTIDGC